MRFCADVSHKHDQVIKIIKKYSKHALLNTKNVLLCAQKGCGTRNLTHGEWEADREPQCMDMSAWNKKEERKQRSVIYMLDFVFVFGKNKLKIPKFFRILSG